MLHLKGTITALVTPFTPNGSQVDYEKLRELVEWQIQEGVNGLVPMGTTGECPTVSHEEHDKVIATVVKYVNKRVPVIAGTGSNSTAEAVRLTKAAKDVGADACLVVCPYYNKPNQKGLYNHFKTIQDIGLPVVLYNIPGRTGINMTPQTVAQLAKLPNIVAIKEATGSLEQASEIAALCDLPILSGDDNLTLPLMAIGAKGVISVLSNCAPSKVLAITNNVLQGDYESARKAHLENVSVYIGAILDYISHPCQVNFVKSLFMEPNPQPVKQVLEMMGKCSAAVRAPLTSCSPETTAILKEHLVKAKLIQ